MKKLNTKQNKNRYPEMYANSAFVSITLQELYDG